MVGFEKGGGVFFGLLNRVLIEVLSGSVPWKALQTEDALLHSFHGLTRLKARFHRSSQHRGRPRVDLIFNSRFTFKHTISRTKVKITWAVKKHARFIQGFKISYELVGTFFNLSCFFIYFFLFF